jgi:hypothetical protein
VQSHYSSYYGRTGPQGAAGSPLKISEDQKGYVIRLVVTLAEV